MWFESSFSTPYRLLQILEVVLADANLENLRIIRFFQVERWVQVRSTP